MGSWFLEVSDDAGSGLPSNVIFEKNPICHLELFVVLPDFPLPLRALDPLLWICRRGSDILTMVRSRSLESGVPAQVSASSYDYGFKRRGLPPNDLCLQNGPSRSDAHV
ncbi:hypothetical protein AVEN_104209-1 [Araneus ventricosus]|uniref:Uncharacterized protein n=1 Tax=Araneus ventricosus TaxID=182803 RepID=A0A4Y2JVN9_ARAVE|nr:hypothetical protein AVEN_104209-1 [Araneus ventricosus]